MKQSALTIIAKVADVTANVTAELAELGVQLDRGEAPDVAALRGDQRVHFLSFFSFGGEVPQRARFVVLEVIGDGSRAGLREWLVERCPGLLRAVFAQCDVPRTAEAWRRFLREHDAGADAFYLGHPGCSVPQIVRERGLRADATRALDRVDARLVDATSRWQALQTALQPSIDAVGPAPGLPFWVRCGLHPKGARDMLRRGLAAIRSIRKPLTTGLGLAGWLLAAPLMPLWAAPALLVVPALVGAGTFAIWRSERPVHAKAAALASVPFEAWLEGSVRALSLLGLPFLIVPALALSPLLASVGIGLAGVAVVAAATGIAYVFGGRAAAIAIGVPGALLWTGLAVTQLYNPLALFAAGAAGTALVAATGATGATVLLGLVFRAERNDREDTSNVPLSKLDENTAREDVQLQNHLATVTELRRGRVRHYALRVVLRAVNLASKVYFNQGDLDGIRSIHFGRFLIHSYEGNRRLIFMGNYDGGFSAYLGAFSKVLGTTAVWSGTTGFPRTFALLADGARDEQRFKMFGRRSQVRTLGWFSAYPGWSTQDVLDAAAVRAALQREPAARRSAWLRLKRALSSAQRGALLRELQGPFDEAGCDAALRRV